LKIKRRLVGGEGVGMTPKILLIWQNIKMFLIKLALQFSLWAQVPIQSSVLSANGLI